MVKLQANARLVDYSFSIRLFFFQHASRKYILQKPHLYIDSCNHRSDCEITDQSECRQYVKQRVWSNSGPEREGGTARGQQRLQPESRELVTHSRSRTGGFYNKSKIIWKEKQCKASR